MNEAMKFLESPGVITTVGLMVAIIGLAAVNIIQSVMYRRVRKRADLFKCKAERMDESYCILLTDSENVIRTMADNKKVADELSASNFRLTGIIRSLRDDVTGLKDNRRREALDRAIHTKRPEDTHADVVACAKAYYRFLIGKA